MSQENMELVARCYERMNLAYQSGDYGRDLDDIAHADVVLRTSGMFPESGEHHGYQGLRHFAQNQAEAFQEPFIQPLEIIDGGHRIVAPITFGGTARHTGIPVTFAIVHVWTIRDGKVAAIDMYPDRGEALKAVGLEE